LKLPLRQLDRHVDGDLAGAYLISGDEPLLVLQAAAKIADAARARGFDQRDLHVVDRGFRWGDLEAAAENLSLFAARRIVELRLLSPRPGDAGSRTLRALVESGDADRILIVVVLAKLDAATARSAWVKAFDVGGVQIDVWPVERGELPRWIAARAAALELSLSNDAAELLADRVEGNLLAADQELRKLAATVRDRRIDEAMILDSVADSARFDVFRLTDALVAGDARRTLGVLAGLRREGVQPVLISWALSRELGLLARLKFAELKGESVDAAMNRHRVWRKHQNSVRRALARYDWPQLKRLLAAAADVDRAVKGDDTAGGPWEALTSLVVAALAPRRRSHRVAS
jgi:DNA polymerase III subunit delta